MLAGTSVHEVEGAPPNGCSSVCVPEGVLLPLWETLQDQEVGVTQDPFK